VTEASDSKGLGCQTATGARIGNITFFGATSNRESRVHHRGRADSPPARPRAIAPPPCRLVRFLKASSPLASPLGRPRARRAAVFLYAFDVIELDRQDLRRHPWRERRAALAKLIGGAAARIVLSEHLDGDGPAMFRHA
jgi:hypothetical protein